jgi:RNA polymerase sigma-70 factor, ECF subfamily
LTLPWLVTAARRRRRPGEPRPGDEAVREEASPNALPKADLLAALPRLRRYARVLTGDNHRADDLVQDTLARAWEKRGFGRRREQAETSLDADQGPAAGWEIPVRATQSDRLELADVLVHIRRLPAEQRDVLMLAAVEELRYDEIARIQGIPIGTVMSRLNRAREKLRRMLAEPSAPLKAR